MSLEEIKQLLEDYHRKHGNLYEGDSIGDFSVIEDGVSGFQREYILQNGNVYYKASVYHDSYDGYVSVDYIEKVRPVEKVVIEYDPI